MKRLQGHADHFLRTHLGSRGVELDGDGLDMCHEIWPLFETLDLFPGVTYLAASATVFLGVDERQIGHELVSEGDKCPLRQLSWPGAVEEGLWGP